MAKRRVHYVLSTHWDREWYQPVQVYRHRLVQLLDRVLAGLADGRIAGPFTTDGQAIILEDYLEIRPDRRGEIEQLARQGKLVIGPWYVMPDEFVISGESIIRNLRLGRQVARSFGGQPSNAGFVCDMFGHNSQMPQILAGFGIRGGLIWRGLNTADKRNVRWRGADGTVMPCLRSDYGEFAAGVRHVGQFNQTLDAKQLAADLDQWIQREAELTDVDPILAFDGLDHMEWEPIVSSVLAERNQNGNGEYDIAHTCLDDYLAELLDQADRIETEVVGELRDPGRYPIDVDTQWVIPGVLSSRVWMKQANCQCQALLCHWAEPFAALAHAALGVEYPQGFLDVAWRWLLQNHPHDSMGGCSIDQVHADMTYRFSQCRQIAERLTEEATAKIAANVEGEVADDELRIVAFNPLPRSLDQIVELVVAAPTDWPTFNEFFGFEPKPAFRIFDAENNELTYQRLGQAMNRSRLRIWPLKGVEAFQVHEVTVAVPLLIPAIGYTTLTVRPGEAGKPTRHPETPGLADSERSMANEHLTVRIESNGTLTLTDKQTGQTYERLLTFEDCADIGDGWYHGQAVNDQAFVSTGCRADVALVHDGPLLTTFRVRTTMAVPAEVQFDRMTRSERFTEMVIDSRVSLRRGADYVDVETTVHNVVDDHRLRVLFPSGAEAETYLADSAFDVVERPIALRPDNHEYRELEIETKPQQSWTAAHNAKRGLAVVSAGLLETAVRDLPERPIALTLFRGTRRTVFTDGQPDGQLRGPMTFAYRIVPLAGAPDRTRLCEMGQQIAASLRTAQLRPADVALHRTDRTLPPTAGLLQLTGSAVMTSAQQVGDALEVRLFNPNTESVSATLAVADRPESSPRPRHVQHVDFESNPLDEPAAFGGTVEVDMEPKRIVTLRLS